MRQLRYHSGTPSFTVVSTSQQRPITMISRPPRPLAAFGLAAVVLVSLTLAGCRKKEPAAPPMATPSVSLNHERTPLGSPVDITYKFVVAPDAQFTEDLRVMVHVVDADEELIFAFDHNPPVPTSQWKPGQAIEYTKTVFVPILPVRRRGDDSAGPSLDDHAEAGGARRRRCGPAGVQSGEDQLQPQTENVFTIFKDGWHPGEIAEHNSMVEWQWTKKNATLAFKNPKKDSLFYLDVDNPGSVFNEAQQVTVTLGGAVVDQFTLQPKQPELRKIPLKAAQLGSDDLVELVISVDKTYVPAVLIAGNKDPRELGVRVFHAYVDPR
jgi:hypothetical protein